MPPVSISWCNLNFFDTIRDKERQKRLPFIIRRCKTITIPGDCHGPSGLAMTWLFGACSRPVSYNLSFPPDFVHKFVEFCFQFRYQPFKTRRYLNHRKVAEAVSRFLSLRRSLFYLSSFQTLSQGARRSLLTAACFLFAHKRVGFSSFFCAKNALNPGRKAV